jgi:undecaprenyl diphosphate synthase
MLHQDPQAEMSLDVAKIPPSGCARYVAIVSDGSARWAEARGLRVTDGHEAAADTVISRIEDAIDLGVEELTFYAFSTENWNRPIHEVKALFGMLAERIAEDATTLDALDVTVRFIGRRDRGGLDLIAQIERVERLTAENAGLRLYIAFDYGGRDEIMKAALRFNAGGEEDFGRLLRTPGMHDPDLVIRTSGEQRLSNFLLWQCAYSELVFRSELWPDFTRRSLEECLAEYTARKRRFGGRLQTEAQV